MRKLENKYGQFVCMGDDTTGLIEIKEGKNKTRLRLMVGQNFEREYKGILSRITRTSETVLTIIAFPLKTAA